VKTMCRVLAFSESGYYAWCKREPSERQRANERLTEQIRHAYKQGRQVYGSPRVHAQLRAQGITCDRHRVERHMRQAGVAGTLGQRRTAGCS
jgi:putative transposase